jgi:hypothetical protein
MFALKMKFNADVASESTHIDALLQDTIEFGDDQGLVIPLRCFLQNQFIQGQI